MIPKLHAHFTACLREGLIHKWKPTLLSPTVSLGRSRSDGRMPSLVGDSGQVLGVLGWALTGIRKLPFVLQCCRNEMVTETVCGTELWVDTANCVFQLKPSPVLQALGHCHQLGLAYGCETWAYPTNTLLATVSFLLLQDTNLFPQAGITHYSQLLTHSTCAQSSSYQKAHVGGRLKTPDLGSSDQGPKDQEIQGPGQQETFKGENFHEFCSFVAIRKSFSAKFGGVAPLVLQK